MGTAATDPPTPTHLPQSKQAYKPRNTTNRWEECNRLAAIQTSIPGLTSLRVWAPCLTRFRRSTADKDAAPTGSDPTMKDKFGDTALESSDICGHTEVCAFLLKWENVELNDELRKESIVSEAGDSKDIIDLTKQKLTKSKLLVTFR